MEETTLIIRCDIIEPSTMQGYERDPRSAAKRAEAYMRSTGIADEAFFGPENEFFIFDDVRWASQMHAASYAIDSYEGAWQSGKEIEEGNLGHRPGVKGGYFPVPPVDSLQDIRSAMCLALEEMGMTVEVHHHEVATAGQCEIGVKFGSLVKKADDVMILKYVDPQRRAQLRQDGDVHAEAARWRQRQRYARPSIARERRQEPVHGRPVRRPVADGAVLHRRHHEARARDQRVHQRVDEQLQASRERLRRRRRCSRTPRATAPRRFACRTCRTRRRAASKCASRTARRIRTSRSRRC